MTPHSIRRAAERQVKKAALKAQRHLNTDSFSAAANLSPAVSEPAAEYGDR